MPRTRQVPRAEAAPEVIPLYDNLFPGRDPVAEPGTATGTPGNWWTTLALVPEVLLAINNQFQALTRDEQALPPKYRELGITRAGFVQGSQFVFSQHCKAMRRVGFSEQQIADIRSWASSDRFNDDERAVLAFADEVAALRGRVQDATYQRLRYVLSDEGIIRLAMCIVTWGSHGVLCRALRLEYDDVDEHVAEIPAPAPAPAPPVARAPAPAAPAPLSNIRTQPIAAREETRQMADTVTRQSISLDAAQRVIAAAQAKATEMGLPAVIAVVDESGTLKAFSRMDGAALLSVDIAKDKAYTAIAFGIPTDAWFDFIKDDPPLLHGITKVPRLMVFGGGYPLKVGDAIVGGIGVSGGHYHQDMEVAQAGVAALG